MVSRPHAVDELVVYLPSLCLHKNPYHSLAVAPIFLCQGNDAHTSGILCLALECLMTLR